MAPAGAPQPQPVLQRSQQLFLGLAMPFLVPTDAAHQILQTNSMSALTPRQESVMILTKQSSICQKLSK